MMTLEINPTRHDRRDAQRSMSPRGTWSSWRASLPGPRRLGPRCGRRQPTRGRPCGTGPASYCTRLAAHVVGGAAAWAAVVGTDRRQPAVRRADRSDAGTGRGLSDHVSDVLGLMERANESLEKREAIVEAIVALQTPTPSSSARSRPTMPIRRDCCRTWPTRPPGRIAPCSTRELIVDPAFGQVARRLHRSR